MVGSSRFVGSLALAMALLIFGSSIALAPEAKALGATTSLTVVRGDVLVRHADGELAPAREGDVVLVGDTVRTGPSGHAEITYFEGSSVRIEPNTELVVEALSTEADGGTVIAMWQSVGRSWHVVTKLISGSSRYEVRTPSSTASVRGTVFAVDVRVVSDGVAATVTTSEGAVVHSAPDPERPGATTDVRVGAGQQSTKSTGRTTESVGPARPSKLREAPQRSSPAARSTKDLPPKSSADLRSVDRDRAVGAMIVERDRPRPEKITKPREGR